jgi:cell division protein FtsI (penicillin-binding protein 3)
VKEIDKRLLIAFFAMLLIPSLLAMRLVYLQVFKYKEYSAITKTQVIAKRDIPVSRGEIRDRNNRVLALNLDVESLAVNPRMVGNKRDFALKVSRVLSSDPAKIAKKLNSGSRFVWVERYLEPEISRKLKKMGLPGMDFRSETKRYYPLGELACHLIGTVGVDSEGLSGIELMCNKMLIKKGLSEVYMKDGLQREINMTERKSDEHVNVVLTIDATLEYIAQRELEKIREKYNPKRAFVIIQQPFTGEILAISCIPAFNREDRKIDVKDLCNPALNRVFEPGSVFKVVPAAALLEEGLYKPTDSIYCENGKFRLTDDVTINDHEKYKYLTFSGIMAYSSNIGFAKAGMRLGKEKLYLWIRKFGFGSKTESKIPGEQIGIVPSPLSGGWTYTTTPIICYGQGVAVTGLQMVNVYSAIANGGLLMEPNVIKALVTVDENLVWHFKPAVIRRVMSEESARTLNAMLRDVVVYGTGEKAKVQGYQVAGKTGTAQKIDPATRKYSKENYIASFCGFVPADDPMLTILVVVDEPQSNYWASDVAAPAFSDIAAEAMNYWSIRKREKNYYAHIK